MGFLLISLALYLPSTALVPAFVYYLYMPICLLFLIYSKEKLSQPVLITVLFFSLSLILSLIAFFILGADLNYYGNFIPIQIGLISSLICSTLVNKKVAKILIVLLTFEFLIALLQYIMGVNTFFPSSFIASSSSFNESGDLLYNRRVFGFAPNSSGLAGNALICFTLMLAFFSSANIKIKIAMHLLIFSVLIVTFSRSGLGAFLIYFFISIFLQFFSRKVVLSIISILSVFVLIAYFVDVNLIIDQLTRNKGSVDLTGRPMIWSVYKEEIMSSPLFGNFGFKNYLLIPIYGYMHAHNSFIMSLYVFGLIPFVVFILPIVLQMIKKPRLVLITISIVVYSTGQFFLFWGGSLVDVIFFATIFSSIKSSEIN
ncbi:O-antigen ligase family protein [Vibrio astriarenae]